MNHSSSNTSKNQAISKLIISLIAIGFGVSAFAQASAKEFVGTLRTFGSLMVPLEGPRRLTGYYDTVVADGNYFKIVLEGELWAAGQHFGQLYQSVGFDGRDISNDITIEQYVDETGPTNRWDVILKTKANKRLIHFHNEQTDLATHQQFILIHDDVQSIHLMFSSEDAARKFKLVAKAIFK